ncbi:MAG TPA: bifunctional pyr operon transcriptional regulator/uracil phosphoribosyltransferase PyrR [Chitinophagales bacterium]|nr:bifunctional pyr operon transcriptional regulator/uracil phosphoribosyltransferase PyrR [Chitinophagales bacterium]HMU98521.1 bifunctional pyr operon transcriptional regulator/uracil phosphoribosyltransferase PyrR [Chitinophagales bacterium]HMV03403.1 bifunctional pyr operon transcriptional regulator/uracil phosphoribosyltransferase PyrR [Chitinophagales bacterium]HMW95181.1 bifunctional pyr operon transcriptional regulator/uracil phosphoribosyltransferase PyrR [Chitinophagales bacterium]HMY
MSSILLHQEEINLIINRLSRQIIELNNLDSTVIIGVQPRGIYLAEKVHQLIEQLANTKIPYGTIDDTFHRDDFRRGKIVKANETNINFEIEGKNVILIDDVLYTGRTIRAALDALLMYGRPNKIELLVLIDRRFNRELPIQPDFVGKTIDTIEKVKVLVQWKQNEQEQDFVIFENEN